MSSFSLTNSSLSDMATYQTWLCENDVEIKEILFSLAENVLRNFKTNTNRFQTVFYRLLMEYANHDFRSDAVGITLENFEVLSYYVFLNNVDPRLHIDENVNHFNICRDMRRHTREFSVI